VWEFNLREWSLSLREPERSGGQFVGTSTDTDRGAHRTRDCFVARATVRKYSRKVGDFPDPATVSLAVDVDGQVAHVREATSSRRLA
jgi:hypothetical protein